MTSSFRPRLFAVFSLLVGLLHAVPVAAQEVTEKDLEELARQFHRTAEMVPMRDGVKLHTLIYAPKDIKVPLP
jgi:predicted acyl esterase